MADFVDVFGFAGGFAMGMTQAGHHLVGKREGPGGFGGPNMEVNRHLLGDAWKMEAFTPADWTPIVGPPVIAGNPPCSGFSLVSNKSFRGIDSPVNACMHQLVEYGAACETPQVVVFESVQAAFGLGRPLMQVLREKLEALTHDRWDLYHVLHNGLSLRGPAMRKRYFFLAVRGDRPFGVERAPMTRVPVLNDVIGDLEGQEVDVWSDQRYSSPPTWWSSPLRRSDGFVDGMARKINPDTARTQDMLDRVPWAEGESLTTVARRYYESGAEWPESWFTLGPRLLDRDFASSFHQPIRWTGTKHARVATGSALSHIHPHLNRTFTHREIARILGFPDDWRAAPLEHVKGTDATWGKGISPFCGRWIGEWIDAWLDGSPGSDRGELIGEREWKIDHTHDWKLATA